MSRGRLRSLALVLLAVLATAPMVRTVCAWDCGQVDVAPPAEHGHCAQTAAASHDGSAELAALGDCDRCERLAETLRATTRAADPLPAPGLAPSVLSGTPDGQRPSSLFVVAPTRAASPPLRPQFPLRI